MPISLELIQTQVGKEHSVTPDILKSTITRLKNRVQKISVKDNGALMLEAGDETITFLEAVVLREQAKEAKRSGKQAREEHLDQLADYFLRQCIPTDYNYEAAIQFLVGLGLQDTVIRKWSMPEEALEACGEALKKRLSLDKPLKSIQVGNCFGASLAWFSNFICTAHPDSLMISVDPNYSMGGVAHHPQRLVTKLLSHFGLQKNNLMVTGYSLDKNEDHWQASCEELLPNFARMGINDADFILLDGWHDRDYTLREVRACAPLLKPGGLILVDDVNAPEVREAVDEACADGSFINLGMPSRIAIVEYKGKAAT